MKIISTDNFNQDKRNRDRETEDMKGEESISGSTPLPESDDDVDEFEHEMGLYLKEDGSHIKEAGLGEQVNEAEEERFEDND